MTRRDARPYEKKKCEQCPNTFGPRRYYHKSQTGGPGSTGYQWFAYDQKRWCSPPCVSHGRRIDTVIRNVARTMGRGQGYMRVMCHWHPRSSPNGEVLEHILIMERKIGRFLEKGEEVHHLNGVRSDNRPENLELWVISQPPGQRVVDLVAHARYILERYAA